MRYENYWHTSLGVHTHLLCIRTLQILIDRLSDEGHVLPSCAPVPLVLCSSYLTPSLYLNRISGEHDGSKQVMVEISVGWVHN